MANHTDNDVVPKHVGIIMDGNGRWAKSHNLPVSAGHLAGVQNVKRIIKDCISFHIQVLTLYAFSTENWQRPDDEVSALMTLADQFAKNELPQLKQLGVKLQMIGRRDKLPFFVLESLDRAISETSDNSKIVVNLALDYGGRNEIVDSFQTIMADKERGILKEQTISEDIIAHYLYWPDCPDVDLVIRTSGEQRLSNFLLWQAADAILLSTPILWPDFQRKDLLELLDIYRDQLIWDSETDF
jgi:undecaprenyl diphosphate synthase